MLEAPILEGMNLDDLAQRYRGTYIDYGGMFITVTAFDHNGLNTVLHFNRINPLNGRMVAQHAPFEWQKVNVERLPTGYYPVVRNGWTMAALLYYIPARQWHRGYCRANTAIWDPSGNLDRENLYDHLHSIHGKYNYQSVPRRYLTFHDLEKELSGKILGAVISPAIAVSKEGEYTAYIYHRRREMGKINFREKKVFVFPQYGQEMREHFSTYGFEVKYENWHKELSHAARQAIDYSPILNERIKDAAPFSKATKTFFGGARPLAIGAGGGGGDPMINWADVFERAERRVAAVPNEDAEDDPPEPALRGDEDDDDEEQ